jgi:hypothetical protein
MDESPKRRKQRAEPHGYPLYECGPLYNGDSDLSGAQTGRRDGAGLGRDVLGGGTAPAVRFFHNQGGVPCLRY